MPARIRILIVDDHAILRSGLRWMIGAQPDMEVIGEAGDFPQALELSQSLLPDIITLDLTMPHGSGIGTIEMLRTVVPLARIVVLTMHDDPAYLRAALAAGACGYLVKNVADAELISAIRAVHGGRLFVDVQNSQENQSRLDPGRDIDSPSPLATLSVREREILTLLAQGHTNQAVADSLSLSVKTVESYRSRMMQKLGLVSRAELTRLAIELGLLKNSSGNYTSG